MKIFLRLVELFYANQEHCIIYFLIFIILILLFWVRKICINFEQEKTKYEAMLASIGEGVVGVNSDEEIVFMNSSAEKMLGWSFNELKCKSLFDAIPVEDENGNLVVREKRPMFQALSKPTFTSTSTNSKITYYYVRKDKSKFPIGIDVASIIQNGVIIGAVNVFRDITIEKEVDIAKSEFISIASHQLRSPMTAINLFLEDILKDKSTPKSIRSELKDVYQSAKNLSSLVSMLLDVSRLDLGRVKIEPKEIDLVQFFEDYLNELKPVAAKKKINIRFEKHPSKLFIHSDGIALRNLALSIVSNALEYTPDNGKVEVVIKKSKKGKFIISVSDTGIGIPDEEKSKIFQKFARASNAVAFKTCGTGLGLYIAFETTRLLGGKVWFESKLGKGTTFFIELPIVFKKIKKNE